MNCLYCQQATTVIDSSDYNSIVNEDLKQMVCYCPPCRAQFQVRIKSQLLYSYFFEYKEYRLYFYPLNVNAEFYCPFYLTKQKEKNIEGDWAYKDVMSLKILPKITPSNVEKKLPTLLVFM